MDQCGSVATNEAWRLKAGKATIKDIGKIVLFGREAHESSAWGHIPYSAAKFRKSIKTLLRRPDCVVLVARNPDICGLLIGMADELLQSNWRFTSEIDFFAKQGGGELIDEFKAWSRSVGAKEIMMSDSNGDRLKAKDRFYRTKGFERRGSMFVHTIGGQK